MVVAPDAGSARRAGAYATRLGLPMAIGDKRRISDTEVEIQSVVGDVIGKKVLIFDDEIATGGSMLKLARYLAEECGVAEVYAGAAHGLLVGPALERLAQPPFQGTVVTDSLPLPAGAEAIHTGESVSRLFR